MFPGSTNVYVLDRVVEQFALSYFSRAYGSPRRVASINENSVEYVVQPRLLEHRYEFERPRTMPLTIVMEFTVYHRGRELFRKTVTSDRFVGDYAWSLTHDNRHHAFENQRYSFVLNSAFQKFVVAFQSTAAETTQLEQASLDSTATSVGSLHKDKPFPANSKPDLPIVTGQSSGPYGTPMDEYGRACISKIHAVAQEQITQPNVFEHNVYATNGCNRVITLKVCYADQRDCTNLTAHPGRESQTTLGIKREEKEFRYDWSYQNF